MNVLVINCGSSSLKYQLINSDSEEVLAKGLCERIGIDGRLVYQKEGLDKEITEAPMPTHKEAIQMVLDALVNPKTGAVKSLAGDRCSRTSCSARRREVLRLSSHHRGSNRTGRGVQRPRTSSQPSQHHRNQSMSGTYAKRTNGRSI